MDVYLNGKKTDCFWKLEERRTEGNIYSPADVLRSKEKAGRMNMKFVTVTNLLHGGPHSVSVPPTLSHCFFTTDQTLLHKCRGVTGGLLPFTSRQMTRTQ